MNQLILGDNLEIMRQMPAESVDLIYLDPPFFSNRNYEVIWGDKGEIRSFEDRWSGGIDHYIAWLKERVAEMHRLLKPTGSIYLHCDWHADAYIRVYILDPIFGEKNFRNQLIWHYRRWTAGKKQFQKMHDNIWFYTKSSKYNFDIPYEPYGDWIKKDYGYIDEETGKRWRWHTVKGNRYKVILEDENKGVKCNDVWQINYLGSTSKERIGYPTQKPEALLERIIKASSNEGDIVLDPFCGGGTTCVVAEKLNRSWLAIDQSVAAVKVTEMRINKNQNLFSPPFILKLHKYDYDNLFHQNPFEFEKWIVSQFKGIANTKQRGDFGLDGKDISGIPIQVKQSEKIGRNVIDNFNSACKRNDKNLFEKNRKEGKPVGFVIAFSFGKGAIEEVARLKNSEDIIIQLVRVDEIVPIAKRPKLKVEIELKSKNDKGESDIEFTAHAESDSGVEFYSFDFDYDEETKIFSAEEILNRTGKAVYKFKPGQHVIAVKAIDNEGLDAIEVIKLKINGIIEME